MAWVIYILLKTARRRNETEENGKLLLIVLLEPINVKW